jgi:hypothetical protein
MKKVLYKFLCLFAVLILCYPVAFPSTWGHLRELVNEEQKAKNNQQASFILGKIIDDEIITYCLDGDLERFPPEKISKYLETALKEWTAGTAAFINRSENYELFLDILPILQRPVRTKLVSCTKIKFFADNPKVYETGSDSDNYYGKYLQDDENTIPDLAIMISSACSENYRHYSGFFASKYDANYPAGFAGSFICVGNSWRTGYLRYEVFLHELGHALGLSDQYFQPEHESNTDANYSSEHREERENSWVDRMLNRFKYGDSNKKLFTTNSVMAADDLKKITCDDADGVITLIDRMNKKKRGGESGWLSMCRDRVYVYEDNRILTAVRYDTDGNIVLMKRDTQSVYCAYGDVSVYCYRWLSDMNRDDGKYIFSDDILIEYRLGENIFYVLNDRKEGLSIRFKYKSDTYTMSLSDNYIY